MSFFSRDAGTSTLGWRAASALRMRVNMSAIGSVVVIPKLSCLPRSFDHAGNFARQRQLPKTDPAQFELADIAPRPPAAETAVAMPAGQLRRLFELRLGESFVSCDFGCRCHVFYSLTSLHTGLKIFQSFAIFKARKRGEPPTGF